jgi:hypothetical protein
MTTTVRHQSAKIASCLTLLLSLLLCGVSVTVQAQASPRTGETIRGRVTDALTGQPIEKARVSTPSGATSTDRDGRFTLPMPSGESFEIEVSAVGYGVARRKVARGAGEVDFRLGQDAVAYSESLDVRPAVFAESPDAPLAQTLQSVELRNLASVVADDVLRSVQSLPGVSGGDDFYGTFSLRGWGFQNTGLYIDGVLVDSPFHTIRDANDAFSLTILNNDVIEGVSLINGAAPSRYGDRVGGVLSIETRDGSRDRTTVRANLGAAGVSAFAEGPIGRSGTSWLFGARKSFLDYVLHAIRDDPSFVVGYYDVQAKLSQRSGAHTFGLFLLHGDSDYEDAEFGLSRNDIARAAAATQIVNARWIWTPSARTSVATAGFWSRETGDNRNSSRETLFESTAGQIGARVNVSRGVGKSHFSRPASRRGSCRAESQRSPIRDPGPPTTFMPSTRLSGSRAVTCNTVGGALPVGSRSPRVFAWIDRTRWTEPWSCLAAMDPFD